MQASGVPASEPSQSDSPEDPTPDGIYNADITAGSLRVRESRIVADLLIHEADAEQWQQALYKDNILQARNPASAKRLARLLRFRLETMQPDLWKLVRDGPQLVATHATLAAAVKHSHLLGDFLDLIVREHYRLFSPALRRSDFDNYLEDCRNRDPQMPDWTESTRIKLRRVVFLILTEAGYLQDTRSLALQPIHIAAPVLEYLRQHDETHVLRCLQVTP